VLKGEELKARVMGRAGFECDLATCLWDLEDSPLDPERMWGQVEKDHGRDRVLQEATTQWLLCFH
jgi:hypothetical protein